VSAPRPGGLVPALLLLLLPSAALPGCRREAPSTAAPGSLAVSASIDPAEIRIGDRARLTVVVDHPAAGTLEPPEFARGKAVVVSDRKRETVRFGEDRQGGSERTTIEVTLTSFELGEHPLGAGKVTFTGAGGTVLTAPVPDIVLRTKSILQGESTPPREIKGLARWPAPLLRWAALAAGFAVLAAAAIFGERLPRRARRREVPAPGQLPLSPHEQALKALAALRGRDLARKEQIEPFYQELSAIVRRYLEDRFGLRAPERTTEEFIREAAGSGLLAPQHQELVRAFLEQCDLVKFARLRPLAADMAQAFEAGVRLVRETRPPAGV
jgi:hypothetical protein